MNNTISPAAPVTSSRTALSRSSNSPRNLAPRDQRAEIKGQEPFALESLGHITMGDPECKPLDDRGFADARLADQDRVILGSPRQHLDRSPDLLVPADHGVELPSRAAFVRSRAYFLSAS